MLWRILLPLLGFLVFSCDGSETPTQIFKRLMENYNRNEAPGFPDKPTEVKLGMYIVDMQYLGDETSEFLVTLYMRQNWNDSRLSFNTTAEKTKAIRFPEDSWKQIWLPDTFIRGARSVKTDDDMLSNRMLKVKADGDVFYVMQLSVVIPSRFNLKNYPFDEQRLELSFESFGYTMDQLYFTKLNDSAALQLNKDIVLRQFDISNSNVYDCSENYTSGAYTCLHALFTLQRRIGPFVLQFYLPSILIVILSWLAFWIDLNTSSPSRLLIGFLSLLALILLNSFVGHSTVPTLYGCPFSCWMIICYVFVFSTLVEFAIVNVLSKLRGAGGFQYLKPPFAEDEKAIEASKEQVDGSRGDGKRKARLVDWFSRILFPIAFLLFNLTYWIIANTRSNDE